MDMYQLARLVSRVAAQQPKTETQFQMALASAVEDSDLTPREIATIIMDARQMDNVPGHIMHGLKCGLERVCRNRVVSMPVMEALNALSDRADYSIDTGAADTVDALLDRVEYKVLTEWGTDWLERNMSESAYDDWLDGVCEETREMPTESANKAFHARLVAKLNERLNPAS